MKDPVVNEVRQIRAKIAQECGYDLNRVAHHAQATAAKIPGLKYISPRKLPSPAVSPQRKQQT